MHALFAKTHAQVLVRLQTIPWIGHRSLELTGRRFDLADLQQTNTQIELMAQFCGLALSSFTVLIDLNLGQGLLGFGGILIGHNQLFDVVFMLFNGDIAKANNDVEIEGVDLRSFLQGRASIGVLAGIAGNFRQAAVRFGFLQPQILLAWLGLQVFVNELQDLTRVFGRADKPRHDVGATRFVVAGQLRTEVAVRGTRLIAPLHRFARFPIL